ncbi:MAG: hypothetical protein R3C13_01325 [Hyphomonas sp.]|uniref:Acg family FMN-binding oxidoreductase n=1 Tax=Hyphomonas sp. TaxID=87 RepID=UPI0035287722
MVSRRALLITGGASILVLGAGYAGLAAMSGIAPALEPWRQATEGFGDVRLNAAAYAILAPNPHNLQPWMIRLDGEDSLTLFCDLERRLPETDPPDRQTTIGLGAFLELLRQAAAEQGYRADIMPFPEGEPGDRLDARPIARVIFTEDAAVARDPLFGLILRRRTARAKFDPAKPVAEDIRNDMATEALALAELWGCQIGTSCEPDTVSWLKDVCKRAWEIELRKPEACHESSALTRIGAKQVIANPDGISLHGTMMEAFGMAGMLTQEKMDVVGSTAWNSTKSFYDGLIDSAAGFAWLNTSTNTRADQLAAGAAWVRLQLAAASHGVAFHPLSQALQEFPEMDGPFAEVHDRIGFAAPSRVQGLFRLGYTKQPGPAPRWPLESRILT